MKNIIKVFIWGAIVCMSFSCTKLLEEKSDKALAVPSRLKDLQALFNSTASVNFRFSGLVEIGSDDYYVLEKDWNGLAIEPRLGYVLDWDGSSLNHWNTIYALLFRLNLILDALPGMKVLPMEDVQKQQLEAGALFVRAMAHFNAAQIWAPQYRLGEDNDVPGIPLRTTSDINAPVKRNTLSETYEQILDDLMLAYDNLPIQVSRKTYAGKAAAAAMLARVYLSMNDFPNALRFADSSLTYQNTLLDYNNLNTSSAGPIPVMNEEVIFHAQTILGGPMSIMGNAVAKADTVLYGLYHEHDIRKRAFFAKNSDQTLYFKGGYDEYKNAPRFAGLTVSEMLLIKAECEARLKRKDDAMETLNKLLQKRWENGTFSPATAADSDEALTIIMNERRKELCFRAGLRWMDLKRFSVLPGEKITIKRVLNGHVYTLDPESPKFLWLIPVDVIALSGIGQNPR